MKASFFQKNTRLFRHKLKKYLRSLNQWFSDTPERALLEAYHAAQKIRDIEIEYFGSKKISSQSIIYTESVMSYWQVCLNKNLTIIKVRLAEFLLSREIINISHPILLEKLKFIDEVVEKYNIKIELNNNAELLQTSQPLQVNPNQPKKQPEISHNNGNKITSIFQKTGVFPRSIGITLKKIKADFSPQAEEEFVKNYRISRKRTITAIRFLIILIIIPLLVQNLSKQILLFPIVERIRSENAIEIFINSDMEKAALNELKTFERKLRLEYLLNPAPSISSELERDKIKQKAIEIAENFRIKSSTAISNVFADFISLIAFSIVVALSKKEIVIIKSFIDNVVYGLSDSAKAFLIILFTDIFVGFHSPHGWEVILEGLTEHLGLPANRNAIFLFIATFPVILDTIFKYWIFRYLSRLSPSALATMKEMND
ncbi:MAG: proton extrusion protein PcxA [Desmonostoc vinosum HA7617-LM4]|nr:proton extrusion protein PcxA [Desmonostoc vinosum HA7617-LM4]